MTLQIQNLKMHMIKSYLIRCLRYSTIAEAHANGPGNSDNVFPCPEIVTRLPETRQKSDSLPLLFLPEDQQVSWRRRCYALQHRQLKYYDLIHKRATGNDKDSLQDRMGRLERLTNQCDMLDMVYPAHLYTAHGNNMISMRQWDNKARVNLTVDTSNILEQLHLHAKCATRLESVDVGERTKPLTKPQENPEIQLSVCDPLLDVPCTSDGGNSVNVSAETDTVSTLDSHSNHEIVNIPESTIKELAVDKAGLSLVLCSANTNQDLMASSRKDDKMERKRPTKEQLENVKQYYIDILPHVVRYGEQTQHKLHHKNIVFENHYWGNNKVYTGLRRYIFEVNKMRIYGHMFYHFEFHVRSITTHPDKGCVRLHWRLYHLNFIGAIKCFIKKRRVNKVEESDFTEGISTFFLNKDGQIIRHKVDRTTPLDSSTEYRLSKLTAALAEQLARRATPSKSNFNKFADDTPTKDAPANALA